MPWSWGWYLALILYSIFIRIFWIPHKTLNYKGQKLNTNKLKQDREFISVLVGKSWVRSGHHYRSLWECFLLLSVMDLVSDNWPEVPAPLPGLCPVTYNWALFSCICISHIKEDSDWLHLSHLIYHCSIVAELAMSQPQWPASWLASLLGKGCCPWRRVA